MSRSNAKSRRLRRRPSRILPASIVAVVLLSLGALTAVAAVSRLATGRWPSQVTGPAQTVAALSWGSTAILTAAIVTAIVGMILLIAGVKLGGHRSAQLTGPDGGAIEQTDYVITNRAIARLAASQADLVDGVDKVSASATGRRVHLAVETTSEQADQIHRRVVDNVTSALTSAGIDPRPRVSATVRTKEI